VPLENRSEMDHCPLLQTDALGCNCHNFLTASRQKQRHPGMDPMLECRGSGRGRQGAGVNPFSVKRFDLYKTAKPGKFRVPMEIAITLLSILHVLVALLLILIVLWQRPRQEGLGVAFGSGMTDQMFGAQTTNVLQKGTVYLAVFFFLNTILIASLMASRTKSAGTSALLDEAAATSTQVEQVPAVVDPGAGIEIPGVPETTPEAAPEGEGAAPEENTAPGTDSAPGTDAPAEETSATGATEETP